MKICNQCKLPKTNFNRQVSCKDGTRNICKDCVALRKNSWYDKTRAERLSKMKAWNQDNKETQRPKRKEYVKGRYKTDIQFKLKARLRSRLGHAIKKSNKVGSAIKDIGCSIDELKTYLEVKFQPGMSWDNWSKTGWQMDHIMPLYKFDLTNLEQFKKACHYTNLQPLWTEDHKKKTVEERKLDGTRSKESNS